MTREGVHSRHSHGEPGIRSKLTSDIGRYAIVPEWLVRAPVSPQAVRLFALMAAVYADREGLAWPTRRRVAEDLDVSVATLDRALHELEELGALSIEPRLSEAGDATANQYRLRFIPPQGVAASMRPPLLTGEQTPPHGRGDGSHTDEETGALSGEDPSLFQTHTYPDPREPAPPSEGAAAPGGSPTLGVPHATKAAAEVVGAYALGRKLAGHGACDANGKAILGAHALRYLSGPYDERVLRVLGPEGVAREKFWRRQRCLDAAALAGTQGRNPAFLGDWLEGLAREDEVGTRPPGRGGGLHPIGEAMRRAS